MNPRPQTTLYLAYIIPNPSEASTFYPQTVIRNSQTGKILGTVNLTQDPNDSLRYVGSFFLPGDSSGNGYYVDLTTIPYTDAGHSVPSQNYWADIDKYFVYQAPSNYGGGYMDFTPKAIRELLREEIKAIKFPEQKDIKIPAFPEIPKPTEVDLAPIHAELKLVKEQISQTHEMVTGLPRFKETDLKPVHARIEGMRNEVRGHLAQHAQEMKKMAEDTMAKSVEDSRKHLEKSVQEVERRVSKSIEELGHKGIPVTMMSYRTEGKKSTPSFEDITKEISKRHG